MPLQEEVVSSMHPTNWVKSQALLQVSCCCVLGEPGVRHSTRGQSLQKGFAGHWSEPAECGVMAHSWCALPLPLLALSLLLRQLWGFPAVGVLKLLSSYTRTLRSSVSPNAFPVLLQEQAKHHCLCPVEKLCGERAWGQHCSLTWDFTVPNSVSS